jgi:hypothetical protein
LKIGKSIETLLFSSQATPPYKNKFISNLNTNQSAHFYCLFNQFDVILSLNLEDLMIGIFTLLLSQPHFGQVWG